MKEHARSINHMLVRLFNDILSIEERSLMVGEFIDVSVREMHVIEAVALSGDENSMSAIAAKLSITVGSLTVAVSTLVRKGYLTRSRAHVDRRVVQVALTDKGQRANAHHMAFHQVMVQEVQRNLSTEQLDFMVDTLDRLTAFFESYAVNTPCNP